MASAKKLPSGAWRTQAKKKINGKNVCRSFTVHPRETGGDSRKAKALSELQAREWQISLESSETYGQTVKEAMEAYIKDRSKVLSPSTIRGYNEIVSTFMSIHNIYINDLKTSDLQQLINEWSLSLITKTIHNRISFLMSCLDYAEIGKKFRLRYPKNNSKVIKSPDAEDVQMLISNARDELKPILCLAAFGALRRGEIPALKEKDISRDMCTVYVHADMVNDGKKWIYKPFTKNSEEGVVQLPKFVIDILPKKDDPEAFLFDLTPDQISHRYNRLRRKIGFNYNFHSLRHFAASFRSDIGIPKKYVEEAGRWKSGSQVVGRIYDNPLDDSRKKYTRMTNDYLVDNFKDCVKKAQ